MSYRILLKGNGAVFFVGRNESLLDAVIRAGLNVNYGCSNGNCGRCKARLVEGNISQIRHSDYAQNAEEKTREGVLMCCHAAVSDLVLEVPVEKQSEPVPEQHFSARVRKVERVDGKVCIMSLRPPRNLRLRFLAGQYALLSGKNFDDEQCSISSCPCEKRQIEFHVPRKCNAFGDYAFEFCRVGDPVKVTAPFGDFFFSEDFSRPALFFAFGTGFAPIKSLVEHITGQEQETSLHLYRITTGGKPYLHNICRSWADAFDDFIYRHVVIGDSDGRDLQSRVRGLVEGLPGLNESDAYLCLPEPLMGIIAEACIGCGLDASRLFCEPVRGGKGREIRQ